MSKTVFVKCRRKRRNGSRSTSWRHLKRIRQRAKLCPSKYKENPDNRRPESPEYQLFVSRCHNFLRFSYYGKDFLSLGFPPSYSNFPMFCKCRVSLLLLLLCTANNRIMLGVPLGWPNCSNWGSYNWPVDLFCSVLHLTALIFLTKSVNASIQRSNPQTPHRGRWIFMRPFQNLMKTYIDRVRLKTPPKKFK